ncbi:MAG: hypothetical protein HFJ50_09025 [Clostridia bacterium]|jgi:hypothetical protein|nr:hypothetical protein [Clostridia bacterium]
MKCNFGNAGGEPPKRTITLSGNYKKASETINNQIRTVFLTPDLTIAGEEDNYRNLKFGIFKCTGVEYIKNASELKDKSNQGAVGRVKKMKFEEITKFIVPTI